MISAMPAVAIRRGRKRSKTFTKFSRFTFPPSRHGSTSSLSNGRQQRASVSTISGSDYYGQIRGFRQRRHPDLDLDKQRRRFLVYLGTLFLITGLLLVFIGVGASLPTAQNVGLLLIGFGAVLCIIKVFCSEREGTEQVARKVVAPDVDVESGDGDGDGDSKADDAATPLADIAETPTSPEDQPQDGTTVSVPNSLSPVSPPNSIPETQVLIGNDSKKY